MHGQQQELVLQPQVLPQPLQPLLPLPLPQQHQTIISRMMIQQQLLPPKPVLHIWETSYELLTVRSVTSHPMQHPNQGSCLFNPTACHQFFGIPPHPLGKDIPIH